MIHEWETVAQPEIDCRSVCYCGSAILAGCYFFILHPQKVGWIKESGTRTEETLLKQLNTQLNQKVP